MRQAQPPVEPHAELEATDSELEIAHISGRRNAQLAAVAVVGVLIAVVWVGVSGRPNPAPVASFNPIAAVEPTRTATQAPEPTPRIQPSASDGPDTQSGPVAAGLQDVFGVYAAFGDDQYLTVLSEPEPGHLFGRIRLPLPPPSGDGTFAFQQFSSGAVRGQPMPIADWPIKVDALAADSPAFLAVNATLPARRTIPGAPRPVEHGYHLTVVAQGKGTQGELTIDIKIGPNRQLQGNDGILGWAVVAQLRKPQVDRARGRYNYCRWDVGALAARPKPGSDEADCQG